MLEGGARMASVALLVTMGMGMGPAHAKQVTDAFDSELDEWRAQRLQRLRAKDGWLTLIGLIWLEPGDNAVGSGPKAKVLLPKGKAPPLLGRLLHTPNNEVWFHAAPGARVVHQGSAVTSLQMHSDKQGAPTTLEAGSMTLHLIERDARLGVRLKDSSSETRTNFTRLDYFAASKAWRLPAVFAPHKSPKELAVPTAQGTVERQVSPGFLRFSHDGQEFTLDVHADYDGELFVVFADGTNGTSTYGAGRFVYAPKADAQGNTWLDFNRSYNPPCAFTSFATCPLPPPQNRLPFEVTAGEKTYARPPRH